ncbi:MAG: hypothetical protein KF819_02890 [Labilithrix sp.]|nr:hypothetical protein [Labilithrix sp.]
MAEGATRDLKAELDERRVARGVAIGLPLVTLTGASVAGVLVGPAMAILVLAAGVLLGVIGLFWASLRVLSGDAPIAPELEALEVGAHAVDALASRKKMLLRALKDLENERALGKLDDDDYEQLSQTYRGELKELLKRIDGSLDPHRSKAEDAARAYLVKAGLAESGYRGDPPKDGPATKTDENENENDDDADDEAKNEAPRRVACAKCETSNETDAAFCKKCGASLSKAPDEANDDASDEKAEAADEA